MGVLPGDGSAWQERPNGFRDGTCPLLSPDVETHTTHADGTPATLDLFLPDTGFADEHVTYDYDSAGRGTSVTYAAGGTSQVLFTASTIDPFGRVREAQYGQTRYTASYADVGRRLQRQASVSSPFGSRSIRHADLTAYDPLGRERSRSEDKQDGIELATTSTHEYAYDALGRLAASRSNTSALDQQFAFDSLGNVLKLLKAPGTPAETTTTLSYQETDRDRICRVSFGRDSDALCNVTYDAAGNITVQPTPSGERRYSYFADGHAYQGMRSGGGHAMRHLIDEGLVPNAGSLASRAQAFERLTSPILRSPAASFDWRLGGTAARAFAGEAGGRQVVVFVAKEGPYQGRVLSAIVPDAAQIAKWGL